MGPAAPLGKVIAAAIVGSRPRCWSPTSAPRRPWYRPGCKCPCWGVSTRQVTETTEEAPSVAGLEEAERKPQWQFGFSWLLAVTGGYRRVRFDRGPEQQDQHPERSLSTGQRRRPAVEVPPGLPIAGIPDQLVAQELGVELWPVGADDIHLDVDAHGCLREFCRIRPVSCPAWRPPPSPPSPAPGRRGSRT